MFEIQRYAAIDSSVFYGIVVGGMLAINILYWLHKKKIL